MYRHIYDWNIAVTLNNQFTSPVKQDHQFTSPVKEDQMFSDLFIESVETDKLTLQYK